MKFKVLSDVVKEKKETEYVLSLTQNYNGSVTLKACNKDSLFSLHLLTLKIDGTVYFHKGLESSGFPVDRNGVLEVSNEL